MKFNLVGLSKTWTLGLSLVASALTALADPALKGLVLYFPLDATGQKQIRDFSSQHNNGAADAIVVSNSPSLVSMEQTRQLTISVWIKPNSIPYEFPDLVCKGGNQPPGAYGGYELVLNAVGDNDLVFESGPTEIYTRSANGSLINSHIGEWIHVAFTINDATKTASFYVNGVDPKDEYDNGSYFNSTTIMNFNVPNNLYVGRPDPASCACRSNFDGSMQNLMIFNRALTPAEIQTIYQTTKPLLKN